MGIFDRIAERLDTLGGGGDDEAAVIDEIAIARGLADRGDVAAAEMRLDDLASRFPRLAAVHGVRGEVRARRGDTEGAADAFGRACNLAPDRAEFWLGLGEALAKLERFEPARDALRRALALWLPDADRPRAQAQLGQLYARAGQLGKAARELRRAVDAAPADAEILAALGRTLVASGEAEGADYLARAARMPQGQATFLVEAAAAKVDHDAAIRLLREALALAPTDTTVRLALVARLIARGDVAAALTEATTATEQASNDDPRAWQAVRRARAAAGDFAAALAAARREAAAGVGPPLDTWLALALGAEQPDAIDEALAHGSPQDPAYAEARAFRDGTLTREMLPALAAHAPTEGARRHIVQALAPPPLPEHNLFGLLAWARELAARHPVLGPLAVTLARAEEAFDRPLRVAVMGEFNAGKSSFVNALAGKAVAPVGITPTTATINILRFGEGGGRALYHDGTTLEFGAESIGRFLAELKDSEAARVRQVEIFSPLEVLRRVEIVDTPGLNSLRPEHERVARDFLIEADALVWVFAVGQAAKATEREALTMARAAGKQVLGVLNKADRASPDEIAAVTRHVESAVGDLVFRVLPLSASRALAARVAGDAAALDASGLATVEAALEEKFFVHARELKRESALSALRRFASDAEITARTEAEKIAAERPLLDAMTAVLVTAEERLRAAIAAERVALRARLDQAIRTAALELRDLAQPRGWGLATRPAGSDDEGYVADVLEEGVLRATSVTRTKLVEAVLGAQAVGPQLIDSQPVGPEPVGPEPPPGVTMTVPPHADELTQAIEAAIDRFRAYARGVFEAAATSLVRQELPRSKTDVAAIRNALARFLPNPDDMLFSTVDRAVAQIGARARRDLEGRRAAANLTRLVHEEHLARPLSALVAAVQTLGAQPAEARI